MEYKKINLYQIHATSYYVTTHIWTQYDSEKYESYKIDLQGSSGHSSLSE